MNQAERLTPEVDFEIVLREFYKDFKLKIPNAPENK